MISFKIFLSFLLLINSYVTFAKISDLRLCANSDCTEPVSLAKTLLLYHSPERGILSFKPNIDVKVYSKSAGNNEDLWGVEINGKRGYAPKKYLKEFKILKQNLTHLVSTEHLGENINSSESKIAEALPTKTEVKLNESLETNTTQGQVVQEAITPVVNVYEGTTITSELFVNAEETTTPVSTVIKPIEQSHEIQGNTVESTATLNPIPDNIVENVTPEQPEKNIENDQVKELRKEEIKVLHDEKPVSIKDDINTVNTSTENIKINVVTSENVLEQQEIKAVPSEEHSSSEIEKFDDESNESVKIEEGDDQVINDSLDSLANSEENNVLENKNEQNKEIVSEKSPEVDKSEESLKNADTVEPVQSDENSKNVNIMKDDKTEPNENDKVPKTDDTVNGKIENSIELKADTPKYDPQVSEELNNTAHKILSETEEVPKIPKLTSDELSELPESHVHVTTEASSLEMPKPIFDYATTVTENPVENSLEQSETTIMEVPITQPLTEAVTESAPLSENNLDVTESTKDIANKLDLADKVDEDISEEPKDRTAGLLSQFYKGIFGEVPNNETSNSEVSEEQDVVQNEEKQEVFKESSTDEYLTKESFSSQETVSEKMPTQQILEEPKPIEHLTEKSVHVPESVPDQLSSQENSEVSNSAEELRSKESIVMQENISEQLTSQETFQDFAPTQEPLSVQTPSENIQNEDIKQQKLQSFLFEKHTHEGVFDKYLRKNEKNLQNELSSCENPSECSDQEEVITEAPVTGETDSWMSFEGSENGFNILFYPVLTAITVLVFSLGYYYIEKKRINSKLISNINELEKKLLVTSKESLLLQDELNSTKERLTSIEDSSFGSDEMVTTLKQELEEEKTVRLELEEQIVNLEKELENATEAGLELNRMLNDFLTSQNGNDNIMENVEHLQKQLIEQQTTINSMNTIINSKNTDNELLQTELSVANGKIEQFQTELDKMVLNLLSVQEEKGKIEVELEEQTKTLKDEYENKIKLLNNELLTLKDTNNNLIVKIQDLQRQLELKKNEYSVLKESMSEVESINTNKETLTALLDVSKVKAEVQHLRQEKNALTEKLKSESDSKLIAEKKVEVVMQEMQILKDKFDEAEKEKIEAQTRLDVLSTYFKDKETQLQKELNEQESLWIQKQGEATSTVERIKWIQEELQNYKSQNELLKKEILDQEVSLKSQISMLEKKAHDNWVLTRQSERKLEEAKQEASQLRNRLTVVEKNLNNSTQAEENKLQNRILQPIESNGDIAVSPLHMGAVEAPGSPPLLYPHRDHMTTSPPIPGLPPFMPPPPPPGVAFMPPPPGVPPFMPPLPSLFPGDHRPPPLGRISSPPLPGRYSPDSRAYSPYDRDDSPPLSPSYTDSDYRRGRSPPPPHGSRTFSPYSGKERNQWDDMRDYRVRPPPQQQRMKPRSHKGTGLSSGSGNSNESLDNSGRHSGRV